MRNFPNQARPHSGRALRLLAMLALAGCVSTSATAQTQEPAAAESSTAAPDESLAYSAIIPRNRAQQSLLTTAQQLIERGEEASGFSLLQEILESKGTSFHADANGESLELKSAVNRYLSGLPEAQRAKYSIRYESQARSALEAARTSGAPDALTHVAVTWFHTPSGRQALHEHALRLLDRGEYAPAAAALRQVVEHPLTTDRRRVGAIAALSFALLQLDRPEEVDQLLDAHAELAARPAPIAGVETSLADWINSQRESPAKSRRTEPAPSDVLAHLPSTLEHWSSEIGPPAAIAELIEEALLETDAQGVVRLNPFVPAAIVDRNLMIARTLDDLIGVRLDTGERLWRTSVGAQVSRLAGNPKSLQNEGFHDLMAEQLLRRVQADDIAGTLSTDGRRVYAIVEPEEPERSPSGMPMRTNVFAANSPPPGNELAAFDVETGEPVWRVHPADLGSDAARTVFRGPPLPLDGMLYGIVSVDRQIRLIAVRAAEGRLVWSLPLAEAIENPAEQRKPRENACPVVAAGGLLLCPTGLGAVAAVDLALRRPVWAFRYQRDDINTTQGLPPGRWSRKSYEAWWSGWRRLSLNVSEKRVLLASPESDALFALDLNTGRLLWKQPRKSGLLVAAVARGRAVLVEPDRVRALETSSGREVWSAAVGVPSGQGALSGNWYLQPLADGNFAAIDVDEGTVVRTPVSHPSPLGNLATAGDRIIVQNIDRLAGFNSITSSAARIEAGLQSNAGDLELQFQLGHLQREAGEFETAIATFQQLESAGDENRYRREQTQTLLAYLRQEPLALERIAPRLDALPARGAGFVERMLAIARARRLRNEPVAAAEALLQLIESRPDGTQRPSGAPRRTVRTDRFLQGELLDLLNDFPQQRDELHQLMDRRRQKAMDSPDPFALQRFAESLSGLEWGRRARTQLAEKTGIGSSFLELQLQWLQLSGLRDPTIAAAALAQLAKLMESRNYRREAAHYYRTLLERFPDVELNDGETSAARIARLTEGTPLGESIRRGAVDPWPVAQPKIQVSDSKSREAPLFRLPIRAQAGALYERLSVSIDQGGKKLRFQGDEHQGFWELNLPVSGSQLRSTVPLHQGWGVGQLLVLRLGSELFGVTALNENGENRAQVLWRVDTLGDRPARWGQWEVRVERAVPGFGIDLPAIGDLFGRTIGQVGPVRAGYLCYFDRGEMIVLDPLTAQRLWVRHDLPPESIAFGDDEHIFLTQRDSREVEVLRVIDGAVIAVHALPAAPSSWLPAADGTVIVPQTVDDHLRLSCFDLTTGREIWQRNFPDRPQLFAVDERSTGLLHADGTIALLDSETGDVQFQQRLTLPAAPGRIFSTRDSQRCYVVLSQGFDNAADLKVNRERGEGFRSPLVSGRLLALDRRTRRLLWENELGNVAFPLDQPPEVPFLVLTFWRSGPRTRAANELQMVVQLLDKRTGEFLHELREAALPRSTGAIWIETNIDQHRASLRTELHTLEVDYAPED